MGGFEAYLEASPGSPGWPDGLRRQGRRHSLISVPRERAARTRRLGQFFVEAFTVRVGFTSTMICGALWAM